MEACLITDARKWNTFIATSTFGAITQTYEWGMLAQRADSIPLYCGVIDEDGNLCAAMLVLAMRLPKVNNSYFYAPRGPIMLDLSSPAFSLLLHFVDSLARKHNAFMLKIDPVVHEHDVTALQAFERYGFAATDSFIHERGEWVLDIYPDEKQQLANMKEKWRYNIRLAQRKGVKIRRGHGPEDIQLFHTLLQETSERDQFFIHAVDHFEYILSLFERDDNAALFLAEYEGKAIAGIIVMRCGDWCWYRYGASSSQARHVMPNHLLQWTGLQWGREHGCTHYNFMGIPAVLTETEGPKDPNWGVYTFKRGFGGQAHCAMRSQEKPYNLTVYRLYNLVRQLKHRYASARYERSELARKRQEYTVKKVEEPVPVR